MKILIVPDTHGYNPVDYVAKVINNYDKVIFMGDYFDSFQISRKMQIKAFKKIKELKKDNSDKIILLLGNHDAQYINKYHNVARISNGYSNSFRWKVTCLLDDVEYMTAVCIEGVLFTHAGVTSKLYERIENDIPPIKNFSFDDLLNRLFRTKYEPLFYCGEERGGSDEFGGILWAHITEHNVKNIANLRYQIVGHTFVTKPLEKNNVLFTDTEGFIEFDTEKLDYKLLFKWN